jgi:ribosomal protein L40E
VQFAADYDHDDNGYLKKSELEDAAAAWNARDSDEAAGEVSEAETDDASPSGDDADVGAADEATAADAGDEAAEGDVASEEASEKACMICSTANAHDASVCVACGYTFES